MRRTAALAAIILLATPSLLSAQTAAPPQAFLFGAWTGGFFPPPSQVSATTCLAQPTVIFLRDVVLRATLTDVIYTQRQVETARGTGNGIDIRFVPSAPQQQAGGFGVVTDQGFGCASPDDLTVKRLSSNEIAFPGCSDFPFPLVRCPAG